MKNYLALFSDFNTTYFSSIGILKDDIVESLEHHYIDCGLMSEEEFRERCV